MRTLPKKDLRLVADFFARQFETKNGLSEDNWEVKVILDGFYKSLKTSSMLPFKNKV